MRRCPHRGDAVEIRRLAGAGDTPDVRDTRGRTPLHVAALIAAAHLGHADVVRRLIAGNNLGWTALIESIVLGDGGPRHTETLRALVEAGARVNRADRDGGTPLALARARGYDAMVTLLQQAGRR
jgi:ankyrin repeat protein